MTVAISFYDYRRRTREVKKSLAGYRAARSAALAAKAAWIRAGRPARGPERLAAYHATHTALEARFGWTLGVRDLAHWHPEKAPGWSEAARERICK